MNSVPAVGDVLGLVFLKCDERYGGKKDKTLEECFFPTLAGTGDTDVSKFQTTGTLFLCRRMFV